MLDVEKFVAGLHDYIGRALSPYAARIKALEERAPVAGQKGDQGERGERGLDGKDGQDGKDGEAGKDGKDGERGLDGKDGQDGKDGRDGTDGKSVTLEEVRSLLESEIAKWALDFERRAQDTLQRAIDKMPAPKDGRDGLSIEDLEVVDDGEGGITLRFIRGEVRREFLIQLPRMKDCGVFREGAEYRKGDGVTWAGNYFLAQKDAPTGKPGESPDWRLAVKRGRDGKDFRPEDPPKPAEPVRLK